MNTTIRSTVSTSIALGLVSFAVTSALVSSVAAPATLVSFGLLAVYGVIEIAIVSYRGPRFVSPASDESMATFPTAPMGTVVLFPSARRGEIARAA